MKGLIDNFALFAALAISGGFFVAAGLTGTEWEDPLRITMYAVIAASVLAVAASYILLIHREHDDKAPFWLVSMAYALGCLGATVLAVLVLTTARILGYAGGQSVDNQYSSGLLEQVMYGGIGGSAVALLLAAASFIYGLSTHQIRRRIPATPWAALKAMFRRNRRP